MRRLPMEVSTLIRNLSVYTRQIESRLSSRIASFRFAGQFLVSFPEDAKRLFEWLGRVDLLSAGKREEVLKSKVCACGLASLDERLWNQNIRTRERYEVPAGCIAADRHGFY